MKLFSLKIFRAVLWPTKFQTTSQTTSYIQILKQNLKPEEPVLTRCDYAIDIDELKVAFTPLLFFFTIIETVLF